MTDANGKGKNPPPKTCPYCGAPIGRLPQHLPCDETPETEAVDGD